MNSLVLLQKKNSTKNEKLKRPLNLIRLCYSFLVDGIDYSLIENFHGIWEN